jgi:Tfp pilus assembly protein PilF
MSGTGNKMGRKQGTAAWAEWVVLALLLSLLAGCATDGKINRKPQSLESAPLERPSVTRLADGRQGFVITEVPQVNETAHRDFQRAVDALADEDYSRAIDLLEKFIEQSPGVTAPYINLAIAYRHLGRLEAAEAHLKTALNLVPGHPVACNEYGLLYRQTGRFVEARAMYENALARFPDYYPVHRNLGILCDLYLNDLECALAHYEIYGRARPEDEQVQLWIADLRNRLKINR